MSYWVRKLGREPAEDDLEPLTRAWWEAGRTVTADRYLLAVQELQRASREIARFLSEHDVWLTPTLSQPPVPVGALRGDDIAQVGQKVAAFLAFPAAVANFTGNPAMSVPLYWNAHGLPIDVHTSSGASATRRRYCGSQANSSRHDRGDTSVRSCQPDRRDSSRDSSPICGRTSPSDAVASLVANRSTASPPDPWRPDHAGARPATTLLPSIGVLLIRSVMEGLRAL